MIWQILFFQITSDSKVREIFFYLKNLKNDLKKFKNFFKNLKKSKKRMKNCNI